MTLIRRAVPADAEAIARVHIASWRASFVPIMTPEQVKLKNLDTHDQQRIWAKRLAEEENITRWSVVAENDAGLVIGYATGRDNDTEVAEYEAELHQIYVAPEYQQQGVGQQMVSALAQRLHVAGYHSLIVWVMTQNPAVAFYRDRLGGAFIMERVMPEADGILKDAAYGWPDITMLFEVTA